MEVTKQDILSLDDVKLLVDSFYGKVRKDELLGNIFESVIQDKWPVHLSKMYQFWQTILLQEHTYRGAPFPPHMKLPINHTHFNRWLTLFYKTVDEHFAGEKAKEAKWRADKMAQMFQNKIAYFKEAGNRGIY